jgi:CheY-like chemotaxis protein
MVSRILLADDSITIQKVVNLTFAEEGIEVIAVSNGEMAAKRLEEVNPDLVLADIFMPGKNGYELCEAIKTNSKFSNVPVVLLVGAFEPFDQVEARRVHADAHLTKPFESRTLVETVRKLLGNTERPQAGPLLAESPAHQESSPSVEDQNSWLTPVLVEATSTLEFESASGQWTAAEMAASATQPPVPESMQLEVAPLAEETFCDFQPDELQSSSFEIERGADSSERPTGELVSLPGGAQPMDPGVSFESPSASAPDSPSQVSTPSVVEHDENAPLEIETQALTLDSPSASGFDEEKTVVDFERSQPSTLQADADALVLTPETSGVELDEEEPGSNEWLMKDVQHAANEWRAANAVNLNTTRLEMPDFVKDDRAALDAKGEDSTDLSFSETTTDPESASLFTAEEPLGDVLFDGAGNEPLAASVGSVSPLDETATTEFTLELSPDEAVRVDQVAASASFDQTSTRHLERITGELVTAELPMEGQIIVESAARSLVPDEPLERFEEAEQLVDREPQIVAADESVGGLTSPGDSVSYDWTSPEAVVNSTGRLDSTIMSVECAEASQELLQQEDPVQTVAADGAIDEPANWEAEQMRFAAIDMEASSIEAPDDLGQPGHLSQRERGFEISAAIVDEQTHDLNENGHREASDLTVSPIELSPMVIDEIVRRVVAEIGDSVVREIAWEIVPDCVERIIEQQTRDSLAKR